MVLTAAGSMVVNALTVDLIGYNRTAALADTARACAEVVGKTA